MTTGDAERFERYAAALKRGGDGVPRLLIDLDRLDANVDRTLRHLGPRALRLVVKSLPAVGLLRHVANRARTRRYMCFHWPFLAQLAREFPDADVLMGKPMPVAALNACFDRAFGDAFDPARQVAWLIDDAHRLDQYLDVARRRDLKLRVAIELDVGIHRGGIANASALDPLLARIRDEGAHLVLAGFMGYDAHAASAPWPHNPRRAAQASVRRYEEFLAHARAKFPTLIDDALIVNGAGSPTLSLHPGASPLTEVAMGSALVKPVDFDVDTLANFEPAAWIATPVLKRLAGIAVPFLERWSWLQRGRDTLFIYGGRWMADPAWPPTMRSSRLYGLSSNQQFMSVPKHVAVSVDDYVFFRPRQSEAVLLEFGDLLALDANGTEHTWPVLERQAR
jgi:D-serine deaminase-like pyridoxal phosphate-dependent protein